MLYRHEPVLEDGAIGGHLTSGGCGHTPGGAVGLGHGHADDGVSADYVACGGFANGVAAEPVPARASLRALYDPAGKRMRADG